MGWGRWAGGEEGAFGETEFSARLGVQGRVDIPSDTLDTLAFPKRAWESGASNNKHLFFFTPKSLRDLGPATGEPGFSVSPALA